ncbi:MAG TPA: YceI family protein [Longimicrobiales bacterium]|nr:YceI family protein [Longimicrobiales bacterium]
MSTSTQTVEQGTATWQIDPAHSHVEFAVKHLMISTVKGRFGDVEGSVTVESDDAETARIDVTIAAESIDTGVGKRDDHLRSADFLHAERYPSLRFESTEVERNGDGELRVKGDLTIRDVTREVVLEVEELGSAKDPWGGERAAFQATTSIDRKDFGLTWNQALETGGVLVGDKVRISIDAQLVLQEEGQD